MKPFKKFKVFIESNAVFNNSNEIDKSVVRLLESFYNKNMDYIDNIFIVSKDTNELDSAIERTYATKNKREYGFWFMHERVMSANKAMKLINLNEDYSIILSKGKIFSVSDNSPYKVKANNILLSYYRLNKDLLDSTILDDLLTVIFEKHQYLALAAKKKSDFEIQNTVLKDYENILNGLDEELKEITRGVEMQIPAVLSTLIYPKVKDKLKQDMTAFENDITPSIVLTLLKSIILTLNDPNNVESIAETSFENRVNVLNKLFSLDGFKNMAYRDRYMDLLVRYHNVLQQRKNFLQELNK